MEKLLAFGLLRWATALLLVRIIARPDWPVAIVLALCLVAEWLQTQPAQTQVSLDLSEKVDRLDKDLKAFRSALALKQ